MYATKVSERVYLLDTYALEQAGTVGAYVVKGPKPTLIDCGYASSYKNVLAGLAEVGVSPTEVRYVIPTHVHLDHAGAVGHLLNEMPNAEVIAHEKTVPHLVDPTRLIESATRVFGAFIMGLYGSPIPVPQDRVTAVGKETSLDLGGGVTANLIHTPGHAPHQISIMLEQSKALLTADAVGIAYPSLRPLIPTTPPPSFFPDQLVDSVRALEQLRPAELLVPHYGVKTEVDWIFEQTRVRVLEWVEQVRKMKGNKLGLDEITQEMVNGVMKEAGVDDIPIYARVSVRTSVMGILTYLGRGPMKPTPR